MRMLIMHILLLRIRSESALSITLKFYVGFLRNRRYSRLSNRVTGCTSWPQGVCGELMSASKSFGAWNRQLSALNSFKKFCLAKGFTVTWPIPVVTLRSYVGWSLNSRKLATSTVRQYLSDLKNFHLLSNVTTKHFEDFFLTSISEEQKTCHSIPT
jgi:hypothetical protein